MARFRVVSFAALVAFGWLAACVTTSNATHKPESEKTRQAVRYFRLAQVEFSQGQNQEAIANLKKAADLDPANAEIHNYLGVVYLFLSDYPGAEKELNLALKHNPYLTDARNSRGAVYMKTGRPAEAAADFQECLKDQTYANRERILYNLGTLQLEQKKAAEAEATFRDAIRANAGYARGYYGLGLALIDLGRKDEARAQFEKVIALDPNGAEAALARERLGLPPAPPAKG